MLHASAAICLLIRAFLLRAAEGKASKAEQELGLLAGTGEEVKWPVQWAYSSALMCHRGDSSTGRAGQGWELGLAGNALLGLPKGAPRARGSRELR